jgi:hypothetical protein
MAGRQFPQVEPHDASMGCPQLGQNCSTAPGITADAARELFSSRSGADVDREAAGERFLRVPDTPGLATRRVCGLSPASHCFNLSNTVARRGK